MAVLHDPGLAAVARVREMKERNSRITLERTLRSVHERELELRRRQADLATANDFREGVAADFLIARQAITFMVQGIREAELAFVSSQEEAGQAHAHWAKDKTQLRAVEMLLERRGATRREERERREVRELDDVAGRLWTRKQGGAAR
jgi:flagellar biosynthesis chaperone FliJ